MARGTIQNRIARLERDGTIAGYTVRLGTQIDERGITALMTIAVEGNSADEVLRSLRGLVIAPRIAGRGRRLLDGLPSIQLETIRSAVSPWSRS